MGRHIKIERDALLVMLPEELSSILHKPVVICPEDAVIQADALRYSDRHLFARPGSRCFPAVYSHLFHRRADTAADTDPEF